MDDTYTFLLVDDSEADAILLQRALVKAQIPNPIEMVSSGEQAIAYLSGAGDYANRERYPLPSLVFLDLRLPGIDGFQVLNWLRGRLDLRHIHVIALSSSPDARFFSKVRELGADHLFAKTHDYKDVVLFVQSFCRFRVWLQPPPATGKSGLLFHAP